MRAKLANQAPPTEPQRITKREAELATALLGSIAEISRGYSTEETFAALLSILCKAIGSYKAPSVLAQSVCDTMKYNFLRN
jgi:hypothetical protein